MVSGDSVDPVLSWKKSVEQSPQESGDIRSKPCSLANLHNFSQSLLGFARSVLQGVYSVGVSTSLLGDFSRFSRNKVYHWLLDIVATFNGDETFMRGCAPLGPLGKMWSVRKKNQKNIFAPNPQFLFYNLKVLYKLRCLQKNRAQKIKN